MFEYGKYQCYDIRTWVQDKKIESDHNVNQMIKIEITKQVNKAVWEIINCGLKSRGAGMKIR